MAKRKNNENVGYYDIQNIIHSMAQESITALNLIIESLEIRDKDSIKMVNAIKEELNSEQIQIDALGYTILSENEVKRINEFWSYFFIAELYQTIGLECISITKHVEDVISYIDNAEKEILDIILFLKRMHNLLQTTSNIFFIKKKDVLLDVDYEKQVISKLKDFIINNLINKMEKESGFSSLYYEIIFIAKGVYNIGLAILEIYNRVEYEIK